MHVFRRLVLAAGITSLALTGLAAAAARADADEILPTGSNGVTYVRTETGRTICGIQGDTVNCTVDFVKQPKTPAGEPTNTVTLSQDGIVRYVAADLGTAEPLHVLHYNETYIANGWAVEAFDDGTRFTNNRSNKAFWVSVTEVNALGAA